MERVWRCVGVASLTATAALLPVAVAAPATAGPTGTAAATAELLVVRGLASDDVPPVTGPLLTANPRPWGSS